MQLALFLIAERAKGPTSQWSGYIATLPAVSPVPLFWSPPQMALLDGTQLQNSVEGYRHAPSLCTALGGSGILVWFT